MNVHAFADNITLHTKNLTIDTDKIKLYELQGNNTVESLENASEEDVRKIRKFQFVPKDDYLIIYPVNILSKLRKYVVYIPFEGNLTQSLLGYYRSSYFDKQAQKKM
jgi:Peptidase M1 N-terminal domain